ncbi:lithostathine-1-like [Teleopsis dalmanni]|uniref:lithostathine-1-like n=1 Tax=Teleopsis dalmanni TaxID=139649 RepID=UPI0018CD986E|nr:lithostathine-1-like [Teleopsis dalmanni]
MLKFVCVPLLLVVLASHSAFGGILNDIPLEDSDDFEFIEPRITCSLSYACYNGRHYYFETNNKRSRDNAAIFCRNINMELVSIEDPAENDFISNTIKNTGCYKKTFWTSGMLTDTGSWVWGNGDAVKYTNWMAGKPTSGKNQYCIDYYPTYVQWNDAVCGNKHYFICESNNKCN